MIASFNKIASKYNAKENPSASEAIGFPVGQPLPGYSF
jgi:hypothetical protein